MTHNKEKVSKYKQETEIDTAADLTHNDIKIIIIYFPECKGKHKT